MKTFSEKTSSKKIICQRQCCCCCGCWSPDGKTPCLWRTETAQNYTPKMPNVTSETNRKWCFWLLFPLAAAMKFGYIYIRSPTGKTPWKKSPPGRKTPCLWRTEKLQNCTPKMPNVTSETHRKWWWNDNFGCFFPLAAAMNSSYLFRLLLQRLLLLLLQFLGKHHGSEGRRSPKIAPRKCLT